MSLNFDSLVYNNVSTKNGESSGMNTTNIVQSNLTRKVPYSSYSIQHDGTDYFATTTGLNATLNAATSASISAWVNFTNISASRPLVSNWHSGSPLQYLMRWNINGNFQMYFRNAANASVAAGFGLTPTTGVWYNVIGTFDGSTIEIYVNGVKGSSASLAGPVNSVTTSDLIGAYSTARLDGAISNVALWKNTALNQDDVLNIYNNGITQDLSNFRVAPTAWYSMDQNYTYFNGSVLVARDAIGDRDATGVNLVQENIIGNAPGSDANGTGSNIGIVDLKGNMSSSSNNSYSINMADYADGVTNPANSGRSTDTPS